MAPWLAEPWAAELLPALVETEPWEAGLLPALEEAELLPALEEASPWPVEMFLSLSLDLELNGGCRGRKLERISRPKYPR